MITQEQFLKSGGCKRQVWLTKHMNSGTSENDNIMSVIAEKDVFSSAEDFFKGGIDLDSAPYEITKRMLKKNDTLFNANFESNFGSCRVDILKKFPEGIVLYKIKAGSGTERHIKSLVFQKCVLNSLGYKVKGLYLISVNKNYVRGRTLNYTKLFEFYDCLNPKYLRSTKTKIKFIKSVCSKKTEPERNMSKFCSGCEYFSYCYSDLPEKNIFSLGNLPFEVKVTLYNHGIFSYEDYLKLPEVNSKCITQIMAELDGNPIVNKKEIKNFISELSYPLGFLDFEAISPTVPRYKGTKPNERIITQFSYHYIEKENGKLKHKEFIGDGIHYPERDVAEKLIEYIGENDCVLMYSPYEKNCINALIAKFPDISEKLSKIRDNLVDLERPFSSKYLYTKEMRGKSSIKFVLPALYPNDPELDYHKNMISDGSMALKYYMNLIYMPREKRKIIRRELLKYCKLDTLAMVKLLEKLKEYGCD